MIGLKIAQTIRAQLRSVQALLAIVYALDQPSEISYTANTSTYSDYRALVYVLSGKSKPIQPSPHGLHSCRLQLHR